MSNQIAASRSSDVHNQPDMQFTDHRDLFLLFPAVGVFAAGVAIYQRRGSWAAASGSFIGGLLILFLDVAFLLGINLTLFWPFLLIASGLAIVVFSALARARSANNSI